MKRYPVSLAALIVVGCLGVSPLSYGEQAKDHDSAGTVNSRAAREAAKVSEAFDTLGKRLKEKEDGTLVFKLEKEKETANINLSGKDIKSLNLLVTSVKEYADKMKECVKKDANDKISQEFLTALNGVVDFISNQEILTKTEKQIKEKELNTLIVAIERAVAEKATKFSKAKSEFEATDKKTQESLVAIAKALQGGSWDKTIVDEEKITKDPLLKAIKDADEASKVCTLDANTQTGANSSLANQPAPPLAPVDPSALGGGAQTGAGFQQPNQVPNFNPAGAGNFDQNRFQALQDALARATDDRERDRQLQDEFLQRQFDERNRDSDQALAALQRALGQAQRPNNTRGNSDRSTQGPQLSPSVSIPQGQQMPYQQMQMPQFQPQQMPLGQMLNSGPAQPMMPYTPSRFNDDIAARPPVPTQTDQTTMALLQTMQQQNQMFQQMMMGRNPYMGTGAPNVYGNNASMLQSMGRGAVQGGAVNSGRPRVLPQRFNGSATGGVAGRLGVNPAARGNIPNRLKR